MPIRVNENGRSSGRIADRQHAHWYSDGDARHWRLGWGGRAAASTTGTARRDEEHTAHSQHVPIHRILHVLVT